MNRSEAKKRFAQMRPRFKDDTEIAEVLDFAIEALQEPKDKSDDCVSKEWLINEIARRDTTDGTVKVFCGREVNEIILNAPSVTSTERAGEWNRLSHDTFHCKLCGRTFIVIQGDDAMNHCPNCGAKMGEK